jgi:branched-chain amino acid transport system permease protein
MLRLSTAILFLLLAACAEIVGAEEARLCRLALPALNQEGARLSIERTAPGPYPFSVRIDYRAVSPEQQGRMRVAICRFSPTRDARGLHDLAGIATETGPMADASFYFLKRFYLEVPDKAAMTALQAKARSRVPEAPFWAAYAAQQVIIALPTAAAYALIYGLVGRIVLVFGKFAALASLAGVVGLSVVSSIGAETAMTGVLVALAIGVPAAGLHGLALSRTALNRLACAPGQHVLILKPGGFFGFADLGPRRV